MSMTLQEWINAKVNELSAKGYRKVEHKDSIECGLARGAYQLDLFTARQVPLDAEVKEPPREELPDSLGAEFAPGVYVSMEVLPPRKRKTRTEGYRLLLVV